MFTTHDGLQVQRNEKWPVLRHHRGPNFYEPTVVLTNTPSLLACHEWNNRCSLVRDCFTWPGEATPSVKKNSFTWASWFLVVGFPAYAFLSRLSGHPFFLLFQGWYQRKSLFSLVPQLSLSLFPKDDRARLYNTRLLAVIHSHQSWRDVLVVSCIGNHITSEPSLKTKRAPLPFKV